MITHNGSIALNKFSAYWAQTRPHCDAVVFGNSATSWLALEQQANAIAHSYRALGLKPGDRVGCLLPNCAEYYPLSIAAWKCGAVFVPLNVRFGDFELEAICDDADFRIIIATPGGYRRVREAGDANTGDEEVCLYPQHGAASRALPLREALTREHDFAIDADHAAQAGLIVYTSGTTGVPKGVCFSQAKLIDLAFSISLYGNITSNDRFLCLAPLAFGGGILCNLLLAYVFGSTLYIENNFDPQHTLQLIEREKISVLIAVPLLWQYMSQQPNFPDADLSELRWAVSGGAPVPLELLKCYEAKGVIIQQSYGCTEMGGFITLLPAHLALDKPGCCGVPGIGATLKVVDDQGAAVAAGEVGEIVLQGAQLFDGYHNKPDATREAIVNGWYHSGDLGYRDNDGHLYITDRKKNMIISGGINVYPAEVERALLTLPEIHTVAVLGVPSERWGEEVVAIAAVNGEVDSGTLREKALPLLGDFKTPKRFVITSEPFPLTASGKIARGDRLREFLRQLEIA